MADQDHIVCRILQYSRSRTSTSITLEALSLQLTLVLRLMESIQNFESSLEQENRFCFNGFFVHIGVAQSMKNTETHSSLHNPLLRRNYPGKREGIPSKLSKEHVKFEKLYLNGKVWRRDVDFSQVFKMRIIRVEGSTFVTVFRWIEWPLSIVASQTSYCRLRKDCSLVSVE